MTHSSGPPGFLAALAYPFRGMGYLRRRRELWRYAAWAFWLNLAALAVLFALSVAFAPRLADALLPARTPAWVATVLGCLLILAAALLLLFLATTLGNLIAGPFLDAMTARILADLGEPLPPPRGAARSIGRSIVNQVLKLLFFGGVQTALLLLLLTPAAVVHPPLAALTTIFFLAFEYLDYPLDARGLSVPARVRYLFRRPGPALGYGTACFALAFVAYLALPATVAGAALLVHDLDPPIRPRHEV